MSEWLGRIQGTASDIQGGLKYNNSISLVSESHTSPEYETNYLLIARDNVSYTSSPKENAHCA